MEQKRLDEIRAMCKAATPGSWMWDINTACKNVRLVTTHSGQYYVMGFKRWGTQGACPTFQIYDKYSGLVTERGSQGMMRADKLAKSYPGKEHHKGFDDYINHPDALFIANSREYVFELLEEIERLKKLEEKADAWDLYRKMYDETMERLEVERDALYSALGDYARCQDCKFEESCENNNSEGCSNGNWQWRGLEDTTNDT